LRTRPYPARVARRPANAILPANRSCAGRPSTQSVTATGGESGWRANNMTPAASSDVIRHCDVRGSGGTVSGRRAGVRRGGHSRIVRRYRMSVVLAQDAESAGRQQLWCIQRHYVKTSL
jgi:hypothetical protein